MLVQGKPSGGPDLGVGSPSSSSRKVSLQDWLLVLEDARPSDSVLEAQRC